MITEGLKVEILEHRLELFKMKINTAMSRLNQKNPNGALEILEGALSWDVEIYED